MEKKHYQRTDVQVFKDILKSKCFCKNNSLKQTHDHIKVFCKKELPIKGLNIDIQKEISKINIAEYGFKSMDDLRVDYLPDVFENINRITLTPISIYELKDKIDLLAPITKSDEYFLIFISDSFERIKIKAENVIYETEAESYIELYAKKNLQMLHSIFHDATNEVNKICIQKENYMFFKVYVLNTFIYNSILFYQNMFSRFYNEKAFSKNNLKFELLNSIEIQPFMEQLAYYGKSPEKKFNIEEKEVKTPIVWNGQINTLITLVYDLINHELNNGSKLMEANIEYLLYLLNKYVIDKNGNSINKNTSRICLYKYRDDKRAKGTKKIDISKYTDLDDLTRKIHK